MTVESKRLTCLKSARWTNVVSKWGYNLCKCCASKSPVGGRICFPASKGGYKVFAGFVSQRVKGDIARRDQFTYSVAQQPVPAPKVSNLLHWARASQANWSARLPNYWLVHTRTGWHSIDFLYICHSNLKVRVEIRCFLWIWWPRETLNPFKKVQAECSPNDRQVKILRSTATL